MCECMLLSPKGTLDTAWVGHLCFFFCFWLLAEVRAREILRKECVCERERERERESMPAISIQCQSRRLKINKEIDAKKRKRER